MNILSALSAIGKYLLENVPGVIGTGIATYTFFWTRRLAGYQERPRLVIKKAVIAKVPPRKPLSHTSFAIGFSVSNDGKLPGRDLRLGMVVVPDHWKNGEGAIFWHDNAYAFEFAPGLEFSLEQPLDLPKSLPCRFSLFLRLEYKDALHRRKREIGDGFWFGHKDDNRSLVALSVEERDRFQQVLVRALKEHRVKDPSPAFSTFLRDLDSKLGKTRDKKGNLH